MDELFVVGVSHNTKHGEVVSDVILLTKDIKKALRAARAIKDLGYECFTFDTGVTIRRMKLNHTYPQVNLQLPRGKKPPRVFVFSRIHFAKHGACDESHWEEMWFDGELQKLMNDGAPLN